MGGPDGNVERKNLLETFDGMTRELDERAAQLANAHDTLDRTHRILGARLIKATVDGNAATSESMQNSMIAVFGRMDALRGEMETVSDDLTAIDEQYLMVNRLPPPINE